MCVWLWQTLQLTQDRMSESGLSVISVTLSVRLHLTNERCWQLAPSSPGSAEWDRFVSRPLSGPFSLCSSPSSSVSFFLAPPHPFFPSHQVSGRAMATGQPQGHLLAFSIVTNWPWGTTCLQIASEMKRFWMLHSPHKYPQPQRGPETADLVRVGGKDREECWVGTGCDAEKENTCIEQLKWRRHPSSMLCIEGQGMNPPNTSVGSAKMLHRFAQCYVDYL